MISIDDQKKIIELLEKINENLSKLSAFKVEYEERKTVALEKLCNFTNILVYTESSKLESQSTKTHIQNTLKDLTNNE
jgi:hypothetical protein